MISRSSLAQPEQFPVEIDRIRAHYDRLSFLYRLFWGEHLHHGFWENNESAPRAQIQLMEQLAERAGVPRGARVLDIGCGLGGSALWLAKQFDCDVTGIAISPVQARMAAAKAKTRGLTRRVRFEVNDADQWQPEPASVDLIWIMESSEHFHDKPRFFERCARALKPGGVLAVCAWLRRDGPPREDERSLVNTIAKAMLSASLGSLGDYQDWMREAGLTVTAAEDITRNVEQTWSHCARIGANPAVRFFLRFTGEHTQRFVRSFPLMKQAYAPRRHGLRSVRREKVRLTRVKLEKRLMIRLLVTCLLLSQLPPLYPQAAKWRTVETTSYPWAGNSSPYTFIVERSAIDRSEDMPRLRIKGPDQRGFTIVLPGGLDKISNKKLTADNLIKSSYLYLTPKLKGTQGRPMLMVFGWAYGSDPGSLRVLALDKTGYPTSVFRSDTFEVAALQDIDGDGMSEIIGKHCLSQLWGTCFSTYDPYSVYYLPVSGEGKATLSLGLSKKYNLKHYYGWAGPHCSEDLAVVLCAPKGKPKIMSAKEAEGLYSK